MKGFCTIPSSKLHKELRKRLGNNDMADKIYVFTQTDVFAKAFGDRMIYSEDNEPTVESVLGIVNVRDSARNESYRAMLEESLNIDLPGSNVDVVRKAVEFNKTNPDFYAVVADLNHKGSRIVLKQRSATTKLEADALEANLEKFDAIDKYLSHLGIPVRILDPTYFNGEDALMIPSNSNPLTQGLFGVVNIANNMAGFKAITEEFGHFIVECLGGNEVVQRAEQFLNDHPDILQQIFGDEYETVNSYYENKGNPGLVAREALGRILSGQIDTSMFDGTVVGRAESVLKNYISKFRFPSKAMELEFTELVSTLNSVSREFVQTANSEQINESLLKSRNVLAHTSVDYNDSISKLMDKLRERAGKYIQIYHNRNTELTDALQGIFDYGKGKSAFSKDYSNIMWSIIRDYIKHPSAERSQFLMQAAHYKTIIGSSNQLLSGQLRDILDIEQQIENGSISFDNIVYYADRLKEIRDFVLVYMDTVDEMLNMMTLYRNRLGFEADELNLLDAMEEDLLLTQRLLNTTSSKFKKMQKDLIYQFYLPTFNPNGEDVITLGGTSLTKEFTISLTDILDHTYGDISWLDRMMDAGYNSSDILTQLVSTKIKQQQEKIRLQTQAEIQTLAHLLQLYGKDTEFMHEKGPDGKPTGYYVNPYGIDFRKYEIERDKAFKKIDESSDDEMFRKSEKKKWYYNHTTQINVSKYSQSNGLWVKSENEHITIRIPVKDSRWNSNAWNNLTSQQQELATELLEYKHKMDVINGLVGNFRPFKCVQKEVSSLAEAVASGNGGFVSMMKRQFGFTDEDATIYGDTINDNLMAHNTGFFTALSKKMKDILSGKNDGNIKETIHQMSDFENRVYRNVPLSFVADLPPVARLSTNAFDSLLHYTAATYQHEGMNEIADIMELTLDVANMRKEKRFDGTKRLVTRVKHDDRPDDIVDIEKSSYGSNINIQIEHIISTQLFSEYKERGSTIFNDSISLSKLIDGVLRLTSLSMLGYNPFTGINNIIVGKAQMLIQSWGSEYFTINDWRKAEETYTMLLGDYLKELNEPFKTSKMALIEQLFNPHNDWWNEVVNKGVYKANSLRVFEEICGPSFMMHAGEHNLKFDTCLALMYGTKMLDNMGRETNLYDALEEYEVPNRNGVGTHKALRIKAGYTKPDGTEFTLKSDNLSRSDLQIFTDKMTITNHRMHGIYDKEDYIMAKRYAVGRVATLFRNFMYPYFSRRWKGIGRMGLDPKYNVQLGRTDEGYYVTTLKFLQKMFFPNVDTTADSGDFIERAKLLAKGLSADEKANLMEMLAETVTTLVVWALLTTIFRDWDDDEGNYAMRFLNYFTRRLQTEMTYGWNPKTLMDILQSPTPVMGPLKDWTRVVKSIGDDHILQSGPYKGETRLSANFKRAMPIVPNVIDFIHLDTEDKRFKIYEDSFFYRNKDKQDSE